MCFFITVLKRIFLLRHLVHGFARVIIRHRPSFLVENWFWNQCSRFHEPAFCFQLFFPNYFNFQSKLQSRCLCFGHLLLSWRKPKQRLSWILCFFRYFRGFVCWFGCDRVNSWSSNVLIIYRSRGNLVGLF